MRWKVLALMPLLVWALVLPARAATQEEILSSQEEALDVDELERAAGESGGEIDYGTGLEEGLEQILDTGSQEIGGVVHRAVRSGVLILLILLLCGVVDSLQSGLGRQGVPAAALAGTLAVTAVAVADVNSLLGLGREAIGNMTSFANVLLPTVAAVTAATGAVTGATVRQMAAVLFSDALVNLINGLLIPLLYGYIAACVANAALGNEGLKRVAGLFKWAVTTILTTVMLAFVGYLTVSGVVAGSADAMTVKATKFAISGAIPVVGGILSDAAETILASAGVLKGTVGVFGMLTILAICLLPLLQMAVHYLLYKVAAALSATVGTGPLCSLVDQIGGAFGLLLGMTGACCLLLLIALVSSVSVAAA
ncbi:MAG TPA: stage III sporulation protein AE [Candidatus Enterenecus stercoripullorum]|nr:stage III sporulation protein AE [Candidatus Enterenecus stercoripullorum]